jgi:fimbrial chaperone protein
MKPVSLQLAIGIATCLGICAPALANFEVSPFVLRLHADQGQLSGWFEVKPNQDQRPVAVELTLFDRVLDINGVEDQNSRESKDLTIYPSQLVVYPGEKVKVQVVWAGASAPIADRAYTVLAKEVPVNLNQPGTKDALELNFKTLVRYRCIVAIETGKKGNLSVVSTKKIDSANSEIVVENKGAGRIPMEGFRLLIAGKKYENFPGLANAIMPGDKRRFVLPISAPPAAADIHFGASDGPLK